MTSPICTVQDGAGAPQATTNGVNVGAGDTITIQLSDLSSNVWSIAIVGQDELVSPPTLTIDSVNKKATFTAPGAGSALIFQSQVNGGKNPNGTTNPAYTTTFGVYVLAASGNRVAATNERAEGSAAYGWTAKINPLLRSGGGVTGTGTVTLEQFGAVGDGVTSDNAAWTSAIAALTAGTYKTILLGANKTYLVNVNVGILPAGCSIIGTGDSSVLKTTGNGYLIKIGGEYCTVAQCKLLGNNTGASQVGIANCEVGGVTGYQNLRVHAVMIQGFYQAGIIDNNVVGDDSLYHGAFYSHVNITGCTTYGFWSTQGYVTLNDCQIWNCAGSAARIQNGNITMTGGMLSSSGIGLDLIGGGNDGHGSFTGVLMNHNTVGISVTNSLANGETFVGCQLYTGSISLVSSNGVHFSACQLDPSAFTFDGSLNTRFSNCIFPSAYANTVTNSANAHPSTTYWENPVNLSGAVPTWLVSALTTDGVSTFAERSHPMLVFTFPTDANQTLTAAQSRINRLQIQAGVTTAARSITIAHAPTPGYEVWVKNLNAQTITVQCSSGTGVAIPTSAAGTSTKLIADGTNLVAWS